MMCAVCNSGPLTHLWQIGLWPAFQAFSAIYVPERVIQEVETHVPLAEFTNIAMRHIHKEAIAKDELADCRAALTKERFLSETDVAVVALAQRLRPDLTLTDDLTLRRALEKCELQVMGSVGLVVHAYKIGLLTDPTLDDAIELLFSQSSLYLSPQFKSYVRKMIQRSRQQPLSGF